ncbi:MCE family protein [Mycolicibacterium fortuitum]|uniref:MCE family protein n=1 Tax=Mycolicibacterium fortuitum TaxID=1766 RepID=UPI0007EB938A|nr:MCE family protein [Mycolicibacterium fortuitum]MDG5773256.1 MCE family protein [Mycolicibacterium fortuitum]MDG5783360.1 MCE family protein [Mycolicibacterium fortuitum]MDG5785806.1 MCE family protein [Mycolicibacterium fortuitum]NOQ59804.1 MCE family protein [Mycolicibacterium fortuitum]OBB34814.1 MCE-family protein [Mycolicibacterium fortuitum]
MSRDAIRLLTGLTTVAVIAAIVTGSIVLFRGGVAPTASVTVISPRAGLVMNPDAKVKLHGAQVGKVVEIQALPDGQAALKLAMNPDDLQLIPANTGVEIASSTVFGAKFVQLVPPAQPSPESMYPGQVLDATHTTVEINTVFEQLVSVLAQIQPEKLNETLGAMAQAIDGRGDKLGQTLVDLDAMLAKISPSLPTLSHEMAVAPQVLNAYADVAPQLMETVRSATQLSDTVVDRRNDLDALLISAIGLADVGNDVVATNSAGVIDAMRLLVPTTNLLNQYNPALNCALKGMEPLAMGPPQPLPGVMLLDSFLLGTERYRYPGNLPKVAATGGPQCQGLPEVGFEQRPPFVVTDIDANPAQYGNQGILLNSDALKQALYGPLDGPPRNTPQIGQPG